MMRSTIPAGGTFERTLMTPVPARESCTTAALAIATDVAFQLMTETAGAALPEGHAIRLPFVFIVVTAKFTETARAVAGMPHCPVMVKSRVVFAASEGPPYG